MPSTDKISRSDIEAKFREISDQLEERAEGSRPTLIAGGGATAVAAILLAFLLGRRRGRRRSTVVEIRRV